MERNSGQHTRVLVIIHEHEAVSADGSTLHGPPLPAQGTEKMRLPTIRDAVLTTLTHSVKTLTS